MKKSSIFIAFFIFTITINVYAYQVIPSGEAVGIYVKTQGLIVTNTSKITDVCGHAVNAAHSAGIKPGDIITDVNGNKVNTPEELSKIIQSCIDKVTLNIIRDNKSIKKEITPINTTNGKKLGIWVKNNAAGIGTITFIDPKTRKFFSLGHPITDVDTNHILPIMEGSILKCDITSPNPSSKGTPGELNGVFYSDTIGIIESNIESGVNGYLNKKPVGNTIEVAEVSEIAKGDAYILANVDGSGVKKYNISITNVFNLSKDNKNMVIEITDKELLLKTGGIVQGMSGAPIIQNNKLIGAVTHVFVNNPKQGYAIFAKNMIN